MTAEVSRCVSGIHACRVEHLPYWLNWELWRVELGGKVVEGDTKLVAERGRLVDRIDAWAGDLRAAFGRACSDRVLALHGAAPDSTATAAMRWPSSSTASHRR